jgi:hypothetical protein
MSENLVTPMLFQGLSNIQHFLENPEKSKVVQSSFSYKYTPLNDILDILRPRLKEMDLILIQAPYNHSEKAIGVKTRLLSKDGGEISFSMHLPIVSEIVEIERKYQDKFKAECVEKKISDFGVDPQELGSALTYLRRYSLLGLFNIFPDNDDDGNLHKAKKTGFTPEITNKKKDEGSYYKNQSMIAPKPAPKPAPIPKTEVTKPVPTQEVIHEMSDQKKKYQLFPFGVFKGKAIDDVPIEEVRGWINFLAKKDFKFNTWKGEFFSQIGEYIGDKSFLGGKRIEEKVVFCWNCSESFVGTLSECPACGASELDRPKDEGSTFTIDEIPF